MKKKGIEKERESALSESNNPKQRNYQSIAMVDAMFNVVAHSGSNSLFWKTAMFGDFSTRILYQDSLLLSGLVQFLPI